MTDAPRLSVLALFAIAVFGRGIAESGDPSADRAARPNVVVIWADDLSSHGLHCYGNALAQTPHIDSIAARACVFDRAYCAYPVCGPSRAACMSGMDAEAVGVMGNGAADRIDEVLAGKPSMAEAFRSAGYRTMRSGKIYHMRVPGDITAGVPGPDHAASWDETYNAHAPEWMTEGKANRLGKTNLTFDRDKHYRLGFGWAFYEVKGSGDGTEQADSLIADHAVRMIGENRDRPFYLAVGFVRPHVPLVAPAELFELYDPAEQTLPTVPRSEPESIAEAFRSKTSKRYGLETDERKKRVIASYLATITFMDQQVGRVLAALEEQGLTDNTIVVFKSDHGYQLGEHDLWQKMSLLEETARIPMMIAAPGMTASRTTALASQIDLYPTLCDLAGVDVPPHVQGVSLKPVMAGERSSVQDAVSTVMNSARLLRTDEHAYLRSSDGKQVALFDMVADPGQHANLAGQPKMAGVERQLDERLDALLESRGIGE